MTVGLSDDDQGKEEGKKAKEGSADCNKRTGARRRKKRRRRRDTENRESFSMATPGASTHNMQLGQLSLLGHQSGLLDSLTHI